MKTIFWVAIILGSVFVVSNIIPINAEENGVQVLQGKDHDTILDYSNGIATTHLYTYNKLFDYYDYQNNPVYVNYKVTQDPNYFTYESDSLSFTFEKNTCDIKVYPGGKVSNQSQPMINSLSVVMKEAINGSDNWVVSPINSLNCNATLQNNGDGIEITSTKSNHVISNSTGVNVTSGKTFAVKYLANPTMSNIEVVPSIINQDQNNDTVKYGFTDTCNGAACGNIQVAGLPLSVNELNATQLDNQTVTLQDGNNKIIYDPQNYIHDYLWAFKKLDSDTSVFDYTFAKNALGFGQTLTIDPTLTTPTGTFQRIGTLTGAGTSCGTPNTKDTTTNQFVLPDTTNNVCYLVDERFDLSSFNKTIVPLTTSFNFGISGVTNAQNCDYVQELNDPNSADKSVLWADITTGIKYLSNDATCTTVASGKSVSLSSQATSDLFTALKAGQSWFALGIKPIGNPLVRDASTHQATFSTPTLSFTYAIPKIPNPPNTLTTTTHAKSLGLTWTPPTWDGLNHAATLISKYWIYYNTLFAYAKQPLPINGTTDPGGFTGAISMSNNAIYLPLDTTNATTNLHTKDFSGNFVNTLINQAALLLSWNFSNSTGFTQVGTTVTIGGGTLNYNALDGGGTDRQYLTLTQTVSNFKQILNGTFHFTSVTSAPSTGIVALTTGTSDVFSSNTQESIIIHQTACNPTFGIDMGFKDAAGAFTIIGTCAPYQISTGTTYYWSFIRTNATFATLYIYSDAAHTTLLSSKSGNNIPSSVNSFTNMVYGGGFCCAGRTMTGTTDDITLKMSGTTIGLVPGQINNAMNFVSLSKQYLTFNSSNTGITGSDFSIFSWIKLSDLTSNNYLLSYKDTGNNQVAFGVNGSYIYIKNGTNYIKQAPVSIGVNRWNHVAYVHHGTNWAILDNGTVLLNQTLSGSLKTPTNNQFYIMGNSLGTIFGNGILDEYAELSKSFNSQGIQNIYNRGFYPLTFSQSVGNITSATITGLADNTNYFVTVFSQNNFLNSTSGTVQTGLTATTPGTPTIKVNTLNQTALQIYFIDGSSGGDPITGHKLQRNGTTLANNTALNPYIDNSLSFNHAETYRACAWNLVGCSSFSGNVTNSTLTFPFIIVTNHVGVGGNVANITTTVQTVKSLPNATITQLQLFNKTTLLQTISVSKVLQANQNYTFKPFWQNVTLSNSYFTVNANGSILGIGAFNQRSNNLTATAQFIPNYLPPPPGDNHTLAWNVTRTNGNQDVLLNVNRQPVTWKIECYVQTTLFDGYWDNHTVIGYFKPDYKVNPYNTVRAKCFNDVPLFNFTLPGNATGIAGFVALDGMMGSAKLFGAPSVLLYVLLFASLYTSRSTHTGIIATVAVIGIFAVIGLLSNLNNVLWSLIFLLAAFGVFMGKKLF